MNNINVDYRHIRQCRPMWPISSLAEAQHIAVQARWDQRNTQGPASSRPVLQYCTANCQTYRPVACGDSAQQTVGLSGRICGKMSFLPARRYASAGNSDRNVSVCPSVRLSRAGIVSKRRKLAAWFLHHLVAPRLYRVGQIKWHHFIFLLVTN